MFGERHHLEEEFPESRDRIEDLRGNDPRFSQLYQEYARVDEEVWRIEEQIDTPSDTYTEDLKKKRVRLKDEIYFILKSGAA